MCTFIHHAHLHTHTRTHTIKKPHLLKKKQTRCYVKSSTAWDMFRPIPGQPHPAALGWLGNGDCYLMHKMESGGWPCISKRLAAVFRSKITCMHTFTGTQHLILGYFETWNNNYGSSDVPFSEMHESRTVVSVSHNTDSHTNSESLTSWNLHYINLTMVCLRTH